MPSYLDRLRRDLAETPAPLAVAVSGGPDSMALLLHAAQTAPTIAATVDHGLRDSSADEAAMVAAWCAARGIAHTTLTPPPDWSPRNQHADARAMRYRLLADWARANGADAVLTAHHADDQAETFLMRAARGSGVAGLAGVRRETEIASIRVRRPLLGWRRAELRALVAAAGVPFVDDPSNSDDRFERARLRAAMATLDLNPAQLAQSAAACAEADAALAAATDVLAGQRTRGDTLEVAGLPRELRRRLLRHALADARARHHITEGRLDTATNVEAMLDALEADGQATLAGVVVRAEGPLWHLAPAPPRRSR